MNKIISKHLASFGKREQKNIKGWMPVYSQKNHHISEWLGFLVNSSLQEVIRTMKPGCEVLDFGCGIGHHTQQLLYVLEVLWGLILLLKCPCKLYKKPIREMSEFIACE